MDINCYDNNMIIPQSSQDDWSSCFESVFESPASDLTQNNSVMAQFRHIPIRPKTKEQKALDSWNLRLLEAEDKDWLLSDGDSCLDSQGRPLPGPYMDSYI
jgi:hypothetical protein